MATEEPLSGEEVLDFPEFSNLSDSKQTVLEMTINRPEARNSKVGAEAGIADNTVSVYRSELAEEGYLDREGWSKYSPGPKFDEWSNDSHIPVESRVELFFDQDHEKILADFHAVFGEKEIEDKDCPEQDVKEKIRNLLDEEGELIQKNLPERLGYSGPHISNTLSEMEENGEIEKVREGRSNKVISAASSKSEQNLSSLLRSEKTREVLHNLPDYESSKEMAKETGLEQENIEDAVSALQDKGVVVNSVEYSDTVKFWRNQDRYEEALELLANERLGVELEKYLVPRDYSAWSNDFDNVVGRLKPNNKEYSLDKHNDSNHYDIFCEDFDAVVGKLEPESEKENKGRFKQELEDLEEDLKDYSDDTGAESTLRGIHKDDLFKILKNSRRRAVIRYFKQIEEEESVQLGELSEEVAAVENDIPKSHVTSDQRKRVYISLYQGHLGEMEGEDIVSYNKSRGIIKPGENFDIVAHYVADDIDVDERVTLENLPGVEESKGIFERIKGVKDYF